MTNTTEIDYMKSVRFTVEKLATTIVPDTDERHPLIRDALLTFAGAILDVARFEAERDRRSA